MKLTANTEAANGYITLIAGRDGELRASKPKDGNAAYVWRMVGFALSSDPRMHCMPTTADFGVQVPEGWQVEPPAAWLAEQIRKTEEASRTNYESNAGFCIDKYGSVEAFHIAAWARYRRREAFIKQVLDPIVDEIVKAVPVTQQPGTRRWARAYGVI